jgi:hypothetical protein
LCSSAIYAHYIYEDLIKLLPARKKRMFFYVYNIVVISAMFKQQSQQTPQKLKPGA